MVVFDKKELRKEILNKRNNINQVEKDIMDNKIIDKFYESNYYKEAQNIFIYISFGSEINTKGIIDRALSENKKIYIPRTDFKTKNMEAVQILSMNELRENSYGILEPQPEEPHIEPNELELIVVPGVAFDENGGRMGYGAGFYDRFFKKINDNNINRIIKVALAYDLQVIDKVPMDELDMPVDYIITEKGFIR